MTGKFFRFSFGIFGLFWPILATFGLGHLQIQSPNIRLQVITMTGKSLDFPTVYSVDRQRCQNERPNERGFTASYGCLHEKYTSEDPLEPWVFPSGLFL